MSRTPPLFRTSLPLLVVLLAAPAGGAARADDFGLYGRAAALDFTLPAVLSGMQGGAVMDHLPDGRLLIATTREAALFTTDGVELRLETAAGSRDFRYLGDLPLSTSDPLWFNPGAFLTASPGNSGTVRVALGNANASLGVFDAAGLAIPATPPPAGTPAPLGIDWYASPGLPFVASAAWIDDASLVVGSGDFATSQFHTLDATSPPAAPVASLVVQAAPQGTGGVTLDGAGDLLVGVGSGTSVGDIRRFAAADWQSGPQDYVTDGPLVTTRLTAAWLQLDGDGNLLIGGGDIFGTGSGEDDFFALHDLSGAGRPDRTFDPDATGGIDNSYSLLYHDPSGTIYAWDNFGGIPRQVYAFAAGGTASVPEPATLAIVAGLLLLAVGSRGRRRG